jgi:hypothetical protein
MSLLIGINGDGAVDSNHCEEQEQRRNMDNDAGGGGGGGSGVVKALRGGSDVALPTLKLGARRRWVVKAR